MNFLCRCCLLLFLSSLLIISSVDADGAGKQHSSAEDYLYLGSTALSEDNNSKAIDLYEKGIAALKDDGSESIITILSLETNLATAYSAIGGDVREKIIEHYEKAISAYDQIDPIDDKEIIEDAKSIASQSYFFYGMVLQDMEGTQQKSLEMYAHAVVLDPNLWAAWGNLGASKSTGTVLLGTLTISFDSCLISSVSSSYILIPFQEAYFMIILKITMKP